MRDVFYIHSEYCSVNMMYFSGFQGRVGAGQYNSKRASSYRFAIELLCVRCNTYMPARCDQSSHSHKSIRSTHTRIHSSLNFTRATHACHSHRSRVPFTLFTPVVPFTSFTSFTPLMPLMHNSSGRSCAFYRASVTECCCCCCVLACE